MQPPTYLLNNPVDRSVTARQHVSKGDHLGQSGSANGSPHLHLGQKHGDPGALIGSPTSGYVDHHFPD
jgi:hypothetical protein